METSKYLKLNIMGENDDADILKVAENFQKIDQAAKDWSNFANTGTVLETEGDFQIAANSPIPEEEGAIFSITVKMPRTFAEDDTITVDGVAYTLYQGSDPALSEAWKAGEVVTINFDKTSRRCWASAGGGAPRPLPAQVSNMAASVPEGETPSIVFTWTNPVDENFAGMVLIIKEGSAPNGVTDGVQAYKGTGTTFTYTEGVQWDHTYFARGFAYNSQNKYQLDATGAIASATPSDIPDSVNNVKIEGESDRITISWENPTNISYQETVVVQKISSISENIFDGTEIYRGTGTNVSVDNLQNGIEYFFSIFAVGKNGRYNPPISKKYVWNLPEEPTSWSLLETVTSTKSFVFPETGWFKLVLVGKGGGGGSASYFSDTSNPAYSSGASGGSGGSGGICVSKHGFPKGKSISINFQNGGISILPLDLKVTSGGNGTSGKALNSSSASAGEGGIGGTASGGNISNVNGKTGNKGTTGRANNSFDTFSCFGGNAVSSTSDGETSKSGTGGGAFKSSEQYGFSKTQPSNGTSEYVKIYRGNTNIPFSQQLLEQKLAIDQLTVNTDYRLLMLEFGSMA